MSGGKATERAWGDEAGGGSLTREVEEGVEDVEALHVVPLDELVGIVVEDFSPGEGARSHCGCGEHLAGSCPSNHNPKPHCLEPEGPLRPPRAQNSPLEEAEAVGADQQVPMRVHLQQVPVQGVEHQPPAARTPVSTVWDRGGVPVPLPHACPP